MPTPKKTNSSLSKTMSSTPKIAKSGARVQKETLTTAQKINKAKANLMGKKASSDSANKYTKIGNDLQRTNINKYNRLKGFEAKAGSKSDAREMAKIKADKAVGVGSRMKKSASDRASRAQATGEASRTYARAKNQRFK